MTIDRAIKTGQQYRRDGEPHDLQDFEDFVDLGIEALKRLKKTRGWDTFDHVLLLPGETKD